jgi:hypothetical protein
MILKPLLTLDPWNTIPRSLLPAGRRRRLLSLKGPTRTSRKVHENTRTISEDSLPTATHLARHTGCQTVQILEL